MRRQTRAQVLGEVERLTRPGAWVSVVGPLCRTWFVDQGSLYELFEYLTARQLQIAVLGSSGFLFCARAGARMANVKPLFVLEGTATADALFAQSALCIALGPRTSPLPEKASAYVLQAFTAPKPVWVLWADENFTFVPAGAAVVDTKKHV